MIYVVLSFFCDDTSLHQSNVSGKVSASREQSEMSLFISYAEAPPEFAVQTKSVPAESRVK